VADVVERLIAALQPDDTVIGGGNVNRLDALPRRCRAGENANAFLGGFRLWAGADVLPLNPTPGRAAEFQNSLVAQCEPRLIYPCPAGERLPYRYTNEEGGKVLRRRSTRATTEPAVPSSTFGSLRGTRLSS